MLVLILQKSFVVAALALGGVALGLLTAVPAGLSRVANLAGLALVYAAYEVHRRSA